MNQLLYQTNSSQRYNLMSNIRNITNPYELSYKNSNLFISEHTSRQEAQQIARQIGYIYNTFGMALQDLIKVLAKQNFKYQSKEERQSKATDTQKIDPNENNKQRQEGKSLLNFNNKKQKNLAKTQKQKSKQQIKVNNLKRIDQKIQSFDIESDKKPINQQIIQACINEKENMKQNSSQIMLTKNRQSFQNLKYKNRMEKPKQFVQEDANINAKIKDNNQTMRQQPMVIENISDYSMDFIKPSKQQQKRHSVKIQQIVKDDLFTFTDQIDILDDQAHRRPPKYQSKLLQKVMNKESNNQDRQEQFFQENKSMRMIIGRKKKQREQVKGIACLSCDKYYQMFGKKGESLCECTSRHKSNLPFQRKKPKKFTQQFDFV